MIYHSGKKKICQILSYLQKKSLIKDTDKTRTLIMKYNPLLQLNWIHFVPLILH